MERRGWFGLAGAGGGSGGEGDGSGDGRRGRGGGRFVFEDVNGDVFDARLFPGRGVGDGWSGGGWGWNGDRGLFYGDTAAALAGGEFFGALLDAEGAAGLGFFGGDFFAALAPGLPLAAPCGEDAEGASEPALKSEQGEGGDEIEREDEAGGGDEERARCIDGGGEPIGEEDAEDAAAGDGTAPGLPGDGEAEGGANAADEEKGAEEANEGRADFLRADPLPGEHPGQEGEGGSGEAEELEAQIGGEGAGAADEVLRAKSAGYGVPGGIEGVIGSETQGQQKAGEQKHYP